MAEIDIAELDIRETLWRAAKSRQALTDAVSRLDDEIGRGGAAGEWSPGQILRHVVWVECYWTAAARAVKDAPGHVYDLTNPEAQEAVVQHASRLAGSRLELGTEPAACADKPEALGELEKARKAFTTLISSLQPGDFERCLSGPRGAISLRYCVDHVIDHDWDHAVQLSALRT